jgi:hypothetical protein
MMVYFRHVERSFKGRRIFLFEEVLLISVVIQAFSRFDQKQANEEKQLSF